MKTKPQTIADLKFNWTFDFKWKNIRTIREMFETLNPNILKYKIKRGNYEFQIDNVTTHFYADNNTPLSYLIDHLDIDLVDRIEFKDKLLLKLVKFELIAENTFKIHVK